MGEEGCMGYTGTASVCKELPKILAKNPVAVVVDTQGKVRHKRLSVAYSNFSCRWVNDIICNVNDEFSKFHLDGRESTEEFSRKLLSKIDLPSQPSLSKARLVPGNT